MTSMCMVMNTEETLYVGLWQFYLLWKNLCASSIVMMEPAQDREGEDLAALGICWHGSSFLLRNLLLDALPVASLG